jgi:hypothetical protein
MGFGSGNGVVVVVLLQMLHPLKDMRAIVIGQF